MKPVRRRKRGCGEGEHRVKADGKGLTRGKRRHTDEQEKGE